MNPLMVTELHTPWVWLSTVCNETDAIVDEDLDAVRIKIVKNILDTSTKARKFVKEYVYMQVTKRKKCRKTIAEP